MSIKTHIEAIVATLSGKPTFIYGSYYDANELADRETKLPCVFLLDKIRTKGKRVQGNTLINSYEVHLEFFDICEHGETPEYEDIVQSQMMLLVNEFIIKLGNYRDSSNNKVFLTNKDDQYTSDNFNGKYDVNVAGQKLYISLVPMYPDSFC